MNPYVPVLISFAAAVLLIGVFLFIESRAAHPLVPFDIFSSRTRNGSYIVGLLLAASLFSMFFFISLYEQQVLGWDALKAGLAYLPLSVTIIMGAGIGSTLANKIGFKPILAAGMFFTALGLIWFSQVSVDGTYLGDILFPSMIAGLGLGLSFPGATVGGTSGVRNDEAGLASGLINSAVAPAQMALGPAMATTGATGTVTDCASVPVQPSTSETVTAYNPGVVITAPLVVAPLLHT